MEGDGPVEGPPELLLLGRHIYWLHRHRDWRVRLVTILTSVPRERERETNFLVYREKGIFLGRDKKKGEPTTKPTKEKNRRNTVVTAAGCLISYS